eukprot:TRINITY_DN2761_c0_g2_i6.p1 TRINITY_DN2761_c0_g2~~TRINITY_DN2761_c0_g2_i6.p1  ORF type:complete len:136 (-),score=13.53 TRINITY_DN2761_c0_g2_i6:810-1217(-)
MHRIWSCRPTLVLKIILEQEMCFVGDFLCTGTRTPGVSIFFVFGGIIFGASKTDASGTKKTFKGCVIGMEGREGRTSEEGGSRVKDEAGQSATKEAIAGCSLSDPEELDEGLALIYEGDPRDPSGILTSTPAQEL